MIYFLSFLKVNNKNGVSTFCKNLMLIFKKNIKVISLFNNTEANQENEICINLPYNRIFKLINWCLSYRLSSYLFSFFIPEDAEILIINAPSMIRYIKPGYRIIAVQHHKIDTLLCNKANFNNNQELIKSFSHNIHKFVVFSEKDKLEAIKKLSISESKVVVIPHMVQIPRAQPKKVCNKRLVMLARLENKQKRFDLVLNSMHKCLDWELNIYGDGPDRLYIEKTINELKLRNVKLHSATDDVEGILNSNDVHLMTSDYEGFGFSNIEAMRKGLPIIIRNTFPVAESLIEGNGVLLSKEWSTDEFVRALEYINLNYASMSHKSLLLSDKFSPEEVTKKWKFLINNEIKDKL